MMNVDSGKSKCDIGGHPDMMWLDAELAREKLGNGEGSSNGRSGMIEDDALSLAYTLGYFSHYPARKGWIVGSDAAFPSIDLQWC